MIIQQAPSADGAGSQNKRQFNQRRIGMINNKKHKVCSGKNSRIQSTTINFLVLHKVLEAVRKHYPEINGIPFIMGGAAVDFQLCTDIDVFITSSTSTAHQAPDYPDETMKYGEFYLPEIGKKVQVMVSRYDLFDTLNRFDISVHQWAIDSSGRRFGAATATLPDEPIRLIRNNKGTPERLIKLSQRYRQPVVNNNNISI
jgi:hypothetical protein